MLLFLMMLLAHPFVTIHSLVSHPEALAAHTEVQEISTHTPDTVTEALSTTTPAFILQPVATVQDSNEEIHADTSTDEAGNDSTVPRVPFYSQFADIDAPEWRKVACGVASLAMVVNFYEPNVVSANTLLKDGIAEGAYADDAGWSHAGLIALSHKYGLSGDTHSLATLSKDAAFAELKTVLEDGPVMASVHYTFDPKNPIPHLVVVNGVAGDKVFYNDPAEQKGGGSVSIAQFQSAWKKRYIEIRPTS